MAEDSWDDLIGMQPERTHHTPSIRWEESVDHALVMNQHQHKTRMRARKARSAEMQDMVDTRGTLAGIAHLKRPEQDNQRRRNNSILP